MDKILGIDLGTNSIGWALRNPELTENQIEKFGVVTFPTGVGKDKSGQYSFASERTKKRSTRRLYQARKYRLWATLEHLIINDFCPLSLIDLNKWRHYDKEEAKKNNNAGRVYPIENQDFDAWIKLDFNMDGKPDYTSPYQLRKDFAEIKYDFSIQENRWKLGRALYHIAQRRGFKSSRKVVEDSNEIVDVEEIDLQYSEKKKNKRIIEEFENHPQAKTIGQLFAFLENDKIRIRENLAQFAIRENYKDEIKYIFKFQELNFTHPLYLNLVEKVQNKNDGSIFLKRPLRSQKGLVGLCTLEQETRIDKKTGRQFQTGKYRAPISHPNFEKFRAWAFLNNIKYKNNNEKDSTWQSLPLITKEAIYNNKFFRKSTSYFPFSDIIDFVKSLGHDWELNYKSKTSVSACPVSARLKELFGENYSEIKIPKKDYKNAEKTFYNIDDIWHVLFSFEDQECVIEFATQKLNLLPYQIKLFVTAWNTLPVGYAMLSLKAINNINKFLVKGYIYTEAVLLAKLPDVIGSKLWQKHETYILDNIKNVIEENRKQKSIISIVNTLISKYKNLENNDDNGAFYKLNKSDLAKINNSILEHFGESKWNMLSKNEQTSIFTPIQDCYQAFFINSGLKRKDINDERHFEITSGTQAYYKSDSGYFHLPKLIETLKEFILNNFTIDESRLRNIYHPSELNIYPAAKEDPDGKLKLGSPKTGSFKNPMAMRTLHELRKLINYLIQTRQIDINTRVVVEVARELNDANRRWAIEAWQRQRESENQEFSKAIEQLTKEGIASVSPTSNEAIDKVRLFYEQTNEIALPALIDESESSSGKRNKIKAAKDLAIKWNGNGNKLIDKYRMWVEQGYQCLYTGKFITLADLFKENMIDIEHTIPRSISFDNSMSNLTVCYHDYNRTIKKNQIPTQLLNYNNDSGGFTAISPRLITWKDKVERIKQQIEFWRSKSKRASDKHWKDDAIRQCHLWEMELDYWKNKLERFTITEITSGFKNSQKIDTQLISKYAFHYLKTYFEKVTVQKGSVTAEFRKIFRLQASDETKDRSKHSHHAKDAAVLTLIPISAKRDEILKSYYEHKENFQEFTAEPYKGFKREHIWSIDDTVLVNNVAKNKALTPSKRKVRRRGKEVLIPGSNKPMWATGDSIRGQLHKESFYGAIKPAIQGENGNLLKDDSGKFIQEEKISFVIRVPFKYKTNEGDTGFKKLEEIESKIVDEGLKNHIRLQVKRAGGLKEAFEKGIYLLDKNGMPHGNKIRHIRVWASVSEPLAIKKQTNLSKLAYKQNFWASNGENFICLFYKNDSQNKKGEIKKNRELEILNLFDISKLKRFELFNSDGTIQIFRKNKENVEIINQDGQKESPYAQLKTGMKVIFYNENLDELFKQENESLGNYKKRISYSTYKIVKFSGGRITFQHHLEARIDKELEKAYPEKQVFKSDSNGTEVCYGVRGINGFTEKVNDAKQNNKFNNNEPWPRLRYSVDWLEMAIEGLHFQVQQDGEIKWL